MLVCFLNSEFCEATDLMEKLLQAEKWNIKGFVLSMIENALEVTHNQVSRDVIAELIEAGKDMLAHPIELLPHAAKPLRQLRQNAKLY